MQEGSSNQPETSPGTPKQTPPEKRQHSFTAPKTLTKKPKASSTNMREEAFNMMKSVYDNRKLNESSTRDDFDVFGELVGRKVRSLTTKHAQIKVQHLINNILYNAELGMYNKATRYGSSASTISTPSASPNSHFPDHSQSLQYYTIPTVSRNDAASPNSLIVSEDTAMPAQMQKEPLTWAIASSFGLAS